MAKAVANKKVVRVDTETTPEGATWNGEYINWGGVQKKVFVERIETAEMRPLKDPHTGTVMYKRGAGGVTLNRYHTERVVTGYIEREFIVDDLGNGQTDKVFGFQWQVSLDGERKQIPGRLGFRPNPQDVERAQKEARRKKFLDELFEKAEAAGGLDALLEGDDEPPPPAARKKAA